MNPKHARPDGNDGLAEWERELLDAEQERLKDPVLSSIRQMARDLDAAEIWGAGFFAGYRMGRGL